MPGKIKNALCRGAKTYSPYELQMAVGYVKQRRMGLNEAVRYYNIPYSTLRDHVQGLKGNGKPGPPATFSIEEEQALVKYLQTLSMRGFSLNRAEFRDLAIEMCENKVSMSADGLKSMFKSNRVNGILN